MVPRETEHVKRTRQCGEGGQWIQPALSITVNIKHYKQHSNAMLEEFVGKLCPEHYSTNAAPAGMLPISKSLNQ
jgi:hypothetical protein